MTDGLAVRRLFLRNFRNYEREEIAFAPGLNLITGRNGAGKTNLLESLFLLAHASSFRTHRDGDLIGWDASACYIRGAVESSQGSTVLELTIRRDGRKAARANGRTLTRLNDLQGRLLLVLFTPDDLTLVKGGPEHRRTWLDGMLTQLRPAYRQALQRYERTLRQRNEAIRSQDRALGAWDGPLVEYGALLTRWRSATVAALSQRVSERYAEVAGGEEALAVAYQSGVAPNGGSTGVKGKDLQEVGDDEPAGLRNDFQEALTQTAELERRRGYTLRGPHRDELLLTLNGRPMRRYGSQGQQRTCVMALKLGELDVLREEAGRRPVLLLDDVLSELDPSRSRALLREVTRGEACAQTLVTAATTPQDGLLDHFDAHLRVRNGAVLEP